MLSLCAVLGQEMNTRKEGEREGQKERKNHHMTLKNANDRSETKKSIISVI